MEIAIIGTGNVGQALAGSFLRAGHKVTLAALDGEKTRQVAAKLGATAASTVKEAAASADVIVLAVPYSAVKAVTHVVGGAAAGKVVIDATNPLKADFSGLATEGGPSGAELLAAALPDSAVVKAFNTLFASNQAKPDAHGMILDVLFATDDERARKTIRDLATSVGFRAIDAGALAAARELEALAWLNIRLNAANNGSWNSAILFVGAPAAATTEPAVAVR